MKKLLLILVIIVTLGIVGCNLNDGKTENPSEPKKTEYTMAEIVELMKPVYDEIKKECEFLTDDEKKTVIEQIYCDSAKKYGLPVDEKITLRGKVYGVQASDNCVVVSISNKTKDDETRTDYDIPIWCEVKNCSEAIFLKEDEVVAIEGVFLRDGKSDYTMYNCNIISPTIEVPTYKNNVLEINEDAINSYSEYLDDVIYFKTGKVVCGIVLNKLQIDTEAAKTILKQNLGNNSDLETYIEISDYLYTITDENEQGLVLIFSDNKNINISDKIYTKADYFSTMCEVENTKSVCVYTYISYDCIIYKYD